MVVALVGTLSSTVYLHCAGAVAKFAGFAEVAFPAGCE